MGVIFLSACATDHVEQPAPPSAYVTPDVPARAWSTLSSEPPDRCGAGSMAWLVGRPRSEIPVPVDLSNRRVQCTSCNRGPVTVPHRLNIYYNPDTGLVEQVQCG